LLDARDPARENMSAVNMVTEDGLSVDRTAAIKKALCESARGQPWMNKVRAYWGHNYHFHIRIKCPAGDAGCQPQESLPPGDGCDKSLDWWFTDEALHPRAEPPKPPLPMAALPPESFWRNSGQTPSAPPAGRRVRWLNRSASARSSAETTKVR
jgi:hypothetical protein